jgi:hypothetical protein
MTRLPSCNPTFRIQQLRCPKCLAPMKLAHTSLGPYRIRTSHVRLLQMRSRRTNRDTVRFDEIRCCWVVHRRITSPDVRPPQLATSFIQPHQVPSASEHPRQPPSRRCSRLHASRPVRLRRRDFFQGSQPNRFAKVRDLGVTIYRRRIHVRLQLTCGRDTSS